MRKKPQTKNMQENTNMNENMDNIYFIISTL